MSASLPRAVAAFDERPDDYDEWYDANEAMYQAELAAIRMLLGPVQERTPGDGLEIGVGTGRFAGPLGIRYGLEPAPRMAERARRRGIEVTLGYAENIPFEDGRFAFTAFLTSLCFVSDRARALAEARRVTVDGGTIVVAFLNRASDAGRQLDATKDDDPYYASARFFTPEELDSLLQAAGYATEAWVQVVPGPHGQPTVTDGADIGLYCALRGKARSDNP